MKILVALIFICILISLASALRSMLKPPQPGQDRGKMVRSLTWRISLSVFLFALLWLMYGLGWIQPTGLTVQKNVLLHHINSHVNLLT